MHVNMWRSTATSTGSFVSTARMRRGDGITSQPCASALTCIICETPAGKGRVERASDHAGPAGEELPGGHRDDRGANKVARLSLTTQALAARREWQGSHRPAAADDLDEILAWREARTVTNTQPPTTRPDDAVLERRSSPGVGAQKSRGDDLSGWPICGPVRWRLAAIPGVRQNPDCAARGYPREQASGGNTRLGEGMAGRLSTSAASFSSIAVVAPEQSGSAGHAE